MPDVNLDNLDDMLKECNPKTYDQLMSFKRMYKSIKWKAISFTIPMIPKPSKRPRLSGRRIYVPGAAKNGSFFQRTVLPTLQDTFIETPCSVKLDIYVPTPKSFSKLQACLAEMRILRPWTRTGDVDNFEKAVYDMIQPNEKRGHRGILSDDSLIIEACTNKYYSKTPRYELTISYMGKIPESIQKVLKLDH